MDKGIERAALFLLALGEQPAAAVLRHMNPKEIQRIGTAMAAVTHVSRQQLHAAVSDFAAAVNDASTWDLDGKDYFCKVMTSALGGQRARHLMQTVLKGTPGKGLETLKWMNARAVADLIGLEHPQVVAVILSCLEEEQAAQVLSLLPKDRHADVMARIAHLESIHPSAWHDLDQVLEKQMERDDGAGNAPAGGLKVAAGILALMASKGGQVIDALKKTDAELGQHLEDHMLVFDNLTEMDDRSVQALLREVSSNVLAVALKGADGMVREKIFKNMSRRAAEVLREDAQVQGPKRLEEILVAQREVLAVARRMAEAGKIRRRENQGDEGY